MDTLPNWLEPQTQPIPTTTSSSSTPLVKYPRTPQELTYQELTFENFFYGAIDRIAMGHSIMDIVEDDPRGIHTVDFMRWMRKDKTRKEMWKEAEEIAAEILVMQTVSIAEGANSMEDTNRSQLRVNNNWKIAAAYSPKRFGKDTSAVSHAGAGGITINIGTVDSPYAQPIIDNVSDVEVKE